MIDTSLSPEQTAARIGKLTASRIADATARTQKGWGASRATYMGELVAERLTGVPIRRFVTQEMLWGIENEPAARAAYAFEYDVTVEVVGFFDHPEIPMSGASPDGDVPDGMVEFKCPNTATHIDFLISDEVDLRYRKQMAWQLACRPEKQFVDFASFDPRMPVELQLRVRRFERSGKEFSKLIPELEAEARVFLAELAAKVAALDAQIRRAA